ncbi:hypothetical protein OAK24_00865 [Flavobacteriales bacterium]|nr:hypothetical protein [Flavobacteriales bacterium]
MKKSLLTLLCLPFIVLGQTTYVPDDNFEAYLEANAMGNGIPNDNLVLTANISTVSDLYLSYEGVSDLTGIEDFAWLENLYCDNNNLTALDLSSNQYLITVDCSHNYLSFLDLYGASWLLDLYCNNNQLISLDVSNNTFLVTLHCDNNQLTSLDVSGCISLGLLWCDNNSLTSLDVKNGNNTNTYFNSQWNTSLTCINVDDAVWSTANWTDIDPWASFSTNCPQVIFGCTNSLACNYNSLANVDDSSCDLPNGCGDALYLEYSSSVTCSDASACLNLIVNGCTNSLACNYNSLANVDDNSCIYLNIITNSTDVSCYGDNSGTIVATATGGIFPLQYSLGAGLSQANGTFLNLSAGTYYIDVTDANGCSSNQNISITEPTSTLLVSQIAGTLNVSCFGDCDGIIGLTAAGGTPPYFWSWNNGSTDDYLSGLCAGLYSVTLTDANGCETSEGITISEPAELIVSVVSTNETFPGASDGSVNSSISGGTGPYAYSWIDYLNGTFLGTTAGISNLPGGTYSFNVTDANNCSDTLTVNINTDNNPTGAININKTSKKLIMTTDLLGRKTKGKKNKSVFYIYNDGTVEKRITIK